MPAKPSLDFWKRHLDITETEKIYGRDLNKKRFLVDRQNIQKIENLKKLLCHYISKNRHYFNKEVTKLPEYEATAPFHLESFRFADTFLDDT
jgi:hypothetical protein